MIESILRDLTLGSYVLAFSIFLMLAVKAWTRLIVEDDGGTRSEGRVVLWTAATVWFLCRIIAALIDGGWGR